MMKWLKANNERSKEQGVLLLSRNGDRLGVPYKWTAILYVLSVSLENKGFMVGYDNSGLPAGALAYTFGTEEDRYKDHTKVEVHLLYIEERVRNGAMLLAAMRGLAHDLLKSRIRGLAFMALPSEENRRLFGKFAALKRTSEYACGTMDYYTTTPETLLAYASKRKDG